MFFKWYSFETHWVIDGSLSGSHIMKVAFFRCPQTAWKMACAKHSHEGKAVVNFKNVY